MTGILRTVFFLSCIGTVLICLMLILKPVISKKMSARWQHFIWIAVALCMLLPVWKLIPKKEIQIIASDFAEVPKQQTEIMQNDSESEIQLPQEKKPVKAVSFYGITAYIWFFGMCIFLLMSAVSYIKFLTKKKKDSINLCENEALSETKKELNIKWRIRMRISDDASSPMLAGFLFPVIYIPANPMEKQAEKMVFLHELIHYKHKDLAVKWLSLFVNAVHWFNPFAYILTRNIGQSCEMFCDSTVIKNMNEEERKFYMNTILDLIEKR